MSTKAQSAPSILVTGGEIMDFLMEAGARMAFEPADAARHVAARRRKAGTTLRPGEATPLWNALAVELRKELGVHGRQASLARTLGVSRQTINSWLTGRARMPDAERTLQLFAWLLAKRRGQELR